MMKISTRYRLLLILIIGGLLMGCSSTGRQLQSGQAAEAATPEIAANQAESSDPENEVDVLQGTDDPFESANRIIYRFNSFLDRHFIAPAARLYKRVMPPAAQTAVFNFFSNIGEPSVIVNDLIQGKFRQAGEDGLRFASNTVFGLGGLIGIATPMGLEKHDEDFGQTFAKWGFETGPYLVLPLLGPSTIRDGIGLVPYYLYLDPLDDIESSGTRLAARGLNLLNLRSYLLKSDRLLAGQLDPYTFVRESYLQRRLNQVYDGSPPSIDDAILFQN